MVSTYFVDVFKNTPPFFKATYIIGHIKASGRSNSRSIYSRTLRYPICGRSVFKVLCRLLKSCLPSLAPVIQLPRRFFRSLLPLNEREWSDEDYPLPFLRDISCTPDLVINVNANQGYALTKAVHAQFTPLVKFLLDKGASPKCNNGIAVKVAIRSKNFDIFKMLVEWPRPCGGEIEHGDKGISDSSMMGVAISSRATDIVQFYRKKGIVPDIVALRKY